MGYAAASNEPDVGKLGSAKSGALNVEEGLADVQSTEMIKAVVSPHEGVHVSE